MEKHLFGRRLSRWVLSLAALAFLSLWMACQNPESSKPNDEVVKEELAVDSSAGIYVVPTFPPDIPGGANNASLAKAARYAWREFFAMNWPAVPQNGQANERDQPDKTKKFGDQSGPLVWHTFRSKVEIYPWTDSLPPGTVIVNDSTIAFNYDALPAYYYQKPIPACAGSLDGSTAWVNLDETSQIGLNQMYAGTNPSSPAPNNAAPQLIRFLAKANRSHFDYVTQHGFFNHGNDFNQRLQNYKNALALDSVPPDSTIITFPYGTMMVKSAWRQLSAEEIASKRYHMTTVRHYERQPGGGDAPCYYQEQTWGMIALHIIRKTPTAPSFIYATFEQADNILDANGKPLEDENGKIILNPAPGNASDPTIAHTDSPTSTTTTASGPFCAHDDKRLYYKELAPGLPQDPNGGGVCVNKRFVNIPDSIIAVNEQAHNAIKAYNDANGVANSPWLYYKLVNVQAMPFNFSDIKGDDPNAPMNPSTFFQANIVVETDYTLGQFAGRLLPTGNSAGQTSNYVPGGGTAYNVHQPDANGRKYISTNMGGCMGCHGNAQLAGTDFSFILDFGPVLEPDLPPATDASKAYLNKLVRKYKF